MPLTLEGLDTTRSRASGRTRSTGGVGRGAGEAGWIVLIVLNAGMLLNHLVAIFLVAASPDEGRMFIANGVVNALALLVLFNAYRVRQRWAWASVWLVVLATAVTIAYGIDTIGLIYAAVAGVRHSLSWRPRVSSSAGRWSRDCRQSRQ